MAKAVYCSEERERERPIMKQVSVGDAKVGSVDDGQRSLSGSTTIVFVCDAAA